MTQDQFTELVDFLERKFDRIDQRFDRIEARLDALERRVAALEVSHEAMRDDIRALAEGLAMTNERLDRFIVETRERMGGFDVRFDRFEVDFGTVVLDHGRRLRALEGPEG